MQKEKDYIEVRYTDNKRPYEQGTAFEVSTPATDKKVKAKLKRLGYVDLNSMTWKRI